MKKLVKYDNFLILEKYDNNIKSELIKMGVTDSEELERQISFSKDGYLASYLQERGNSFTFGILKAIFKDAILSKKRTDLKKGIFTTIPRILPLTLIPFLPTLAIVATILGTSRLFHKAFDIIYSYLSPSSKYSHFLKKVVDTYMKIPEGTVSLKDRFSRAFVVTDRLIDSIKPEIIEEFSKYLVDKMEKESDYDSVPDYYIENELRAYINVNFGVDPEIPMKSI